MIKIVILSKDRPSVHLGRKEKKISRLYVTFNLFYNNTLDPVALIVSLGFCINQKKESSNPGEQSKWQYKQEKNKDISLFYRNFFSSPKIVWPIQ